MLQRGPGGPQRHLVHALIGTSVHPRGNRFHRSRLVLQQSLHLAQALTAMLDRVGDELPHIVGRSAVRGIEDPFLIEPTSNTAKKPQCGAPM